MFIRDLRERGKSFFILYKRGVYLMDGGTDMMFNFGIVSIFLIIWYIVCLGIGIYSFVLFVKLARRGITALDIYIGKHKNPSQRTDQEV